MHETYDYIVIGADSSGCVAANRLSEKPSHTVLLLEAGAVNNHPNIAIPGAYQTLIGTHLDWNYLTESELF